MKNVLLTSIVLLSLSIATALAGDDPVSFTDLDLKAKVETQLGITDPTQADMLNLTSLYATSSNITNLDGLEYATNLTYLYLHYNSISDLNPLADLTRLISLNIHNNNISDITPIANLTNLTYLVLDNNNNISDITPLANMTSMTSLYLGQNNISDITSLANMTSLTTLHLYNNNITNITALTNMTSLTRLILYNNSISDLTPLANMTSLTELFLFENNISDITPLADMTSLTDLRLSKNNISNIAPLANMTHLMRLDLYNNSITNITPLANMIHLTKLFLYSNSISDITPLANMTQLTYLWLRSNPLDFDAYARWLPMIQSNNPDADITYDPFEGNITVLSPNGSEMVLAERIQLITWSSALLINVDISYSLDNGLNWTWINTVASPDSIVNEYYWKTPQPATTSDQCLIRIEAAGYPAVNDTSDTAFTITPCTITIRDGDLNDDCIVNLQDFSMMAGNWLANGTGPSN